MSVNDAMLLAGAAVIAALVSALVARQTAVVIDRSEREESRKERLRSLYSDVMLAALRLAPDEIPVRLGRGAGPTTHDEIDVLCARLTLERWHEGNRVRDYLKEVWRAAEEWNSHRDEPERAQNLVDPLRRQVVTTLDELEDVLRANLGTSYPPPGESL